MATLAPGAVLGSSRPGLQARTPPARLTLRLGASSRSDFHSLYVDTNYKNYGFISKIKVALAPRGRDSGEGGCRIGGAA